MPHDVRIAALGLLPDLARLLAQRDPSEMRGEKHRRGHKVTCQGSPTRWDDLWFPSARARVEGILAERTAVTEGWKNAQPALRQRVRSAGFHRLRT